MKCVFAFALSTVLLCSCAQQTMPDLSSASSVTSGISSDASSVPSSIPSSAPSSELSSELSSTVSSTPTRKFPYDSPLPLTANDISYLLGMNEKLLPHIVDMDNGSVVHTETKAIYDCEYIIDDAIYLGLNGGKVRLVSIMYNKGKDPTFASLLGINGNDTFDTFVNRFGSEYCYPTYLRSSSNTIEEDKSMCSIQYKCKNLGEPMLDGLHEDPFLRANFDESGKMIELFISFGI